MGDIQVEEDLLDLETLLAKHEERLSRALVQARGASELVALVTISVAREAVRCALHDERGRV